MAKIINLDIPSLEMLLLIIFIFYLIFQVKTPNTLIEFINSNLGMIVILIVTVYLFLFTNPILGILSIFVVYELIRRSNKHLLYTPPIGTSTRMYTPKKIIKDTNDQDFHPHDPHDILNENKPFHSILGLPTAHKKNMNDISPSVPKIQYTETSDKRTLDMHHMNPPAEVTLEEEVVHNLAPIGQSQPLGYIDTTFKPISENVHSASTV